MEWFLENMFERPWRTLGIGLPIILLIGSFIWWQAVWTDPTHVFEDMLANNLTATSVTKAITAGTSAQGVEQTVRLEMGGTNATAWLVTARQGNSIVTTESISTPTTGYIRYVKIAKAQKTGKSTNYNFANVINQWAKSDGQTDSQLNTLFNQSLLDITNAPAPPIGNLPLDQRTDALHFMRTEKVFTPDYSKVKSQTVDGRSVYTYQVSVKLAPYVRLMQAFAQDLGLKGLESIDPSQYSTLPPLTMSVSVDKTSHQLLRITYAPSSFTQDYSSWGLDTPLTLPHATLTTTQLQQRLQALRAK